MLENEKYHPWRWWKWAGEEIGSKARRNGKCLRRRTGFYHSEFEVWALCVSLVYALRSASRSWSLFCRLLSQKQDLWQGLDWLSPKYPTLPAKGVTSYWLNEDRYFDIQIAVLIAFGIILKRLLLILIVWQFFLSLAFLFVTYICVWKWQMGG